LVARGTWSGWKPRGYERATPAPSRAQWRDSSLPFWAAGGLIADPSSRRKCKHKHRPLPALCFPWAAAAVPGGCCCRRCCCASSAGGWDGEGTFQVPGNLNTPHRAGWQALPCLALPCPVWAAWPQAAAWAFHGGAWGGHRRWTLPLQAGWRFPRFRGDLQLQQSTFDGYSSPDKADGSAM